MYRSVTTLKCIGFCIMIATSLALFVQQIKSAWFDTSPTVSSNHGGAKDSHLARDVERREIIEDHDWLVTSSELSADDGGQWLDSLGEAPQAPRRRKIVLFSYPRSGSTLTAEILFKDPSVFYEFEPLWFQSGMIDGRHKNTTTFLDNTPKLFPSKNLEALNMEMFYILEAFINCRFEDLPVAFLTQWTSKKSPDLKSLHECISKKKNDLEHLRECAQAASKNCLNKDVTVTKIIRGGMHEMNTLLKSDPDVKVIYLVRDARGSLRSRKLTKEFGWEDLPRMSQEVCTKMAADFEMSKVIHEHFPGRILSVRYEDLVASPVDAVKQIYQFSGLEFTQEVETFVWNSTYAGNPDECNICTTRSNATTTANKWRKIKDYFEHVETEQKYCAEALSALGYRLLASIEDMMDMRKDTTFHDFDWGGSGFTQVEVVRSKDTIL